MFYDAEKTTPKVTPKMTPKAIKWYKGRQNMETIKEINRVLFDLKEKYDTVILEKRIGVVKKKSYFLIYI